MNRVGKVQIAFVILCAGSALSACAPNVDLQAVQKYAQTTADASDSFSSVAAGFYTSCLRIRELHLKPAEMSQTLIDLAPAYTATSPLPGASPKPAAAACNDARGISIEWDKRNKIVLGYVQALGSIANVDVRPTFAPLGSALVNAQIITQTQDDAFANLAQQLSGAIILGEQRQALANTISAVNPSLKTAIAALKTVDDAYGQELNAEFNDTFGYYNSLIRSETMSKLGASLSPSQTDRIARQRQRFDASLNAVNDRRTSTVGYAVVLDDIQTTHQHLFDAAQSRPTLQGYITIIQKDVMPLYQDVEALRKVVK